MRIPSILLLAWMFSPFQGLKAAGLERLQYNNPGLVVDLGVGLWAWPLPMDWDGDGDWDMVVACPDKPYNGVYVFENPGNGKGRKFPVFKAAKRVGKARQNMQVSHVRGEARVISDGFEFLDFRKNQFGKTKKLVPQTRLLAGKTRARMWRYVDYDGDGDQDVIVGIGYWGDLEWDHAYDAQGVWQNGPLHGYIYLLRNEGTDNKPKYAEKQRLKAGGKVIDVYGWPSPNFADFDGDGDLDLLCGEFLDGFRYFENVGTREQPNYANGRKMVDVNGDPLLMDLQMITPTAIDWDHDGDQDLVCGDEDGRVALIENVGGKFKQPVYFQQEASTLKYGALATPFCVDWDGDGDEDIIAGNTAGYVGFFENLGGGANPIWARVKNLQAAGRTIRIQAGPNGSIQSPCEAKWGYTTLSVADWDHDGLPDLLINSIWGEVLWYRNIGTRRAPKLAAGEAVKLSAPMPKPKWFWWDGSENQLVTQWRTTPLAIDFTKDGLTDLVLLDSEGYLCLYEREKRNGNVVLNPPRRIFIDEDNRPIRLNTRSAGRSGRYKISVVDWDGDGRLDVLVNSENAVWYRNAETRNGRHVLKKMGNLGKRNVSGHTSSPTVCDFDRDGKPDLLVGAEDGRMYYLNHNEAVRLRDIGFAVRGPAEELIEGNLQHEAVAQMGFVFGKGPTPKCRGASIIGTTRGLAVVWSGEAKDGGKTIFGSYHDGSGWSRPVRIVDHAEAQPLLARSVDAYPLLVVGRAQSGVDVLAASYDRGRSYRRLKADAIPATKPAANVVKLADGRMLEAQISENRVVILMDGKRAFAIEDEANLKHAFVNIADDERVHLVYNWNGSRIRHVVLDSSKIR